MNFFSNRNSILFSFASILVFTAIAAAVAPAQSLDRISCVTKTYSSTGTDTCRAFLTSTTSTHLYITLSSNNPAVVVPSQIMVSYYAASKGFYPAVGSVTKPQTAIITAKLNGVSKSFSISLSPASTTSPHQVKLSWSKPASTGNPIVAYNIYRATSGTSSFGRMNLSPDQTLAFTDSNVQSGAAYDYKVTSVDSAGLESSPSSKISVIVP